MLYKIILFLIIAVYYSHANNDTINEKINEYEPKIFENNGNISENSTFKSEEKTNPEVIAMISSENQNGDDFNEMLLKSDLYNENSGDITTHNENVRVQKSVQDLYEESVELFKNVDPHISMKLGDGDRSTDQLMILRRNKYGSQIIEDPLYSEVMKSVPAPHQRSLVIIFDGTGSMVNDLAQLTKGAEAIITEVTKRDSNPIYNYIFVPFRDPYVGPKLVTQNLTKFLNEIKKLPLLGGGDCPESAVGGINLALESALPKSFIFVFTDATARDFGLDDHTIDLIQEKQVTLTFLLTGFCKSKNSEGYKVYEKLAALSNGQIYNLQKTDIAEVLGGIKASLDADLIPINYLYSKTPGSQTFDVPVDENLKEFTVSVAGEKPNITVKNPEDVEHKDVNELLNLNNLKVINVQDPQPGKWNVETEADSEHYIKLTGVSDLKFEFGFSEKEPGTMKDTNINPTLLLKNVLSIAPSNHSLIHNLTSVELSLQNIRPGMVPNITLPLHRIFGNEKLPENISIYSTNPFEPPLSMFKLYVNGFDFKGNPLKHLLSTALKAIPEETPRIVAINNFVEVWPGESAILECKILSSKPGRVVWLKNNTKIHETDYGLNNIHQYQLENVEMKDAGEYICAMENTNGFDEKTINLVVKKRINPLSVKITELNMTATENDVDYQISCFVYPMQNVTYSWLFNGEKILPNDDIDIENENLIIKNVQRANDGNFTCSADNGDITANDTRYLNVLYSPSIRSFDNGNQSIFYGNDVKLDCDADGNPKPTIEWIREPLNWNFQNGYIQEFSVENEGTYKCRASNGIGDVVEKDFFLQGKAKDSPRILATDDSSFDFIVGSDIILSCECDLCDPITESFWKKSIDNNDFNNYTKLEGNLITSIKEYGMKQSQLVLNISNATINDSGNYVCHLENEHGQDEKLLNVQIFVPAFVKELIGLKDGENFTDTVKVVEGDSFTLKCDVSGHPNPVIDWVKHGREITEHRIINNSILEIANATPQDRGIYGCFARNSYGQDFKQINVQVVVPPKLKSSEDAIIIVESGQEVLMECDIIGEPKPNIIWAFNTTNDNPSYLDLATNLLNFTATPKDVGVYECLAENEAGNATKKIFLLVKFEPKIYPESDTTISTRLGEITTLLCRAEGYPEPSIMWRFNGSPINNLKNANVGPSGDLILKDVDISMQGTYICEASNNMGTAQRTITLNVDFPPKILSKFPPTFKLLPRYVLSFECLADGSPKPEVFWTKNGTILSKNEPNSHILKLQSSGESQTDEYVCHAENSEGSDKLVIQVTSLEKPHLIKDLLKYAPENVTEGGTIEIVCPIGEAENFTWYHENRQIPGENRQTLQIPGTTLKDAGLYTCTGKNEAGEQNNTQEVLVWSPPDILASSKEDVERPNLDNTISIRMGNNVTLKCLATGYPKPKIQWEKDSVIISGSPELHLENVQFYHAGEYVCKAKNIFGEDRIAYTIDVLIPPTSQIPINNWKEVFEGDDVEIDCEGYGNPSPSVTWMKDGKELGVYHNVLEIFSAGKEDRGLYTCKLENYLGTEQISFFVDILSQPKIISYPRDVAIINNELMELYCSAEGNPLPILAWGLNSKTILSSAYALSDYSDNFTGSEIIIDEYGNVINYWNPDSNKNKAIWQNMIKPKGLYGKIIKDNDTVSLTLMADDTKYKKSGIYICYAINSLGSDEQKYRVEVQAPPYLYGRDKDKERFVNKTLLEGLPLILSCLWNGNPAPDILWYHDHKFLNERPGYRLSQNNKTLTINNANESNVGLYTCIATNAAGEDRKQFLVDILIPPKIHHFIDEEVLPHTHITGESTILDCRASGNPKPKIFWTKQLAGSDSPDFEILPETSNQLVLDDLDESGVYSCYVNNSLGFVEKQFSVEVFKMPQILDKWPNNLRIKEHQTIALHCRATGSPKPIIRWYKDGLEINGRFPNVNFSNDKTIMKIPNARKKDSGVYICIANNKMGEIQRNVNVTVTRAALWSEWESWTPCSSSCGLGVKTRRRRCIVNGLIANDDNSCSGSNYESERCEMLPCPVNGGWSEWSSWTTCSQPCTDILGREKPTRKRYRDCNAPKPAFGGKHCAGNDFEEEYCNTHYCPINGGWSEWSRWSGCSVTCGSGKKVRMRQCNNPTPSFGGKLCIGESMEALQCVANSCPVNGGWSDWSSWSECSETCGSGVKKRTRTCSNPTPESGGNQCTGANVEVLKCQIKPCTLISDFSGPLRSTDIRNLFTPNKVYEVPDSHNYGHFPEEEDSPEKYQHALGTELAVAKKKNELPDLDYYDELPEVKPTERGIQVVVTYQNYRPISPDLKQMTFFPDKNPYKVEKMIPCELGFEFDPSAVKCIDINECERKGYCKDDQICTNLHGGFRCNCRSGFAYNAKSKKCEDINECYNSTANDCSHGCRNSMGSYHCTCPKGFTLGNDRKTCQPLKLFSFRDEMLSDRSFDPVRKRDFQCHEGFHFIDNICQDIDECTSMDHDCGIDQSCLNTKGSYLCVPTPCNENYEKDELTGHCTQICNYNNITGETSCKEGAKIAETLIYTILSIENFNPSEFQLKFVNYGLNKKALSETIFTIEPGKDSKLFKLKTIPFKKGMSYLHVVNKIKREKLHKIKIKAKSYDRETFELLYVTNFIVFLYIL